MIVVTNFVKVGIFCMVCYTYIAKILICINGVPYVHV